MVPWDFTIMQHVYSRTDTDTIFTVHRTSEFWRIPEVFLGSLIDSLSYSGDTLFLLWSYRRGSEFMFIMWSTLTSPHLTALCFMALIGRQHPTYGPPSSQLWSLFFELLQISSLKVISANFHLFEMYMLRYFVRAFLIVMCKARLVARKFYT